MRRTFGGKHFARKTFSVTKPSAGRLAELKTMPYQEYLQTEEWNRKRWTALSWARRKCAECGTRSELEVHHRTYERRGEERMDDLVVLCRDCHEIEHLRQEIAKFQERQGMMDGEFYGS